MTLTSRRVLNRAKMLAFLEELGKIPAGEAYSLYLPPGVPPAEIEISLKEAWPDISPEITEPAIKSKTGAVLFRSHDAGYLVLPPFPITQKAPLRGFFTEPLYSLLKHDYKIALVLVRLGAYAIGVSEGENLISSKVGTGLVHGRHRQGGSSAHRFERHRDKQIEYFLTRICGHILEHLQPHEKTLDYIAYGGAWTTLQLLQKQCPFLGKLGTPALPPLLDIPEPRRAVLESSLKRIWSSTVLEWRETRDPLS